MEEQLAKIEREAAIARLSVVAAAEGARLAFEADDAAESVRIEEEEAAAEAAEAAATAAEGSILAVAGDVKAPGSPTRQASSKRWSLTGSWSQSPLQRGSSRAQVGVGLGGGPPSPNVPRPVSQGEVAV